MLLPTLQTLALVTVVLVTAPSRQAAAQGSRIAASDTAWIRTRSGLTYVVLAEGVGPAAKSGQTVTIHETTTLLNGTVVFSTRAKDSPVTFQLGGNQVIAGVEEGVTGMRAGERRLLIIPPSLSQRSSYPANTPRDSTLRIDLELVAIHAGGKNPVPPAARRPPRQT